MTATRSIMRVCCRCVADASPPYSTLSARRARRGNTPYCRPGGRGVASLVPGQNTVTDCAPHANTRRSPSSPRDASHADRPKPCRVLIIGSGPTTEAFCFSARAEIGRCSRSPRTALSFAENDCVTESPPHGEHAIRSNRMTGRPERPKTVRYDDRL